MADHTVTAKQIDAFEEAFARGLGIREIAAAAGIAESTVSRWKARKKDGSWDAYAALIREGKSPRWASRSKTPDIKKKAQPHNLPETLKQKVLALKAKGVGYLEIARRLGEHESRIRYFYYKHGEDAPRVGRKQNNARREQVLKLKAQGKKLGIAPGNASYYYYGIYKKKELKENINGTAGSPLNKHTAIGIAYSEVNRLMRHKSWD
jgi:IS30 family transposase